MKNNFARRGDIPILSGDCDGKWVFSYFFFRSRFLVNYVKFLGTINEC